MSEKIHINIPVSEKEQQKILADETKWTAPKLIALMLGTLGVSLIVLYLMASA